MRKADIELRRTNNGYGDPVPTIKVKWYPFWPNIVKRFRGSPDHEFGDDADFWEWAERQEDADGAWDYPNGPFCIAMECSREDGWEQAQSDLEDIFSEYQIKVWSDGRSGGWLIVEGLPDVESWDAIMVARWAKACRFVKDVLDDRDYNLVWHLHANIFENLMEGFV